LRGANFNSGTMEAFAVDSGVWNVENGALKVSAGSLGGDAACPPEKLHRRCQQRTYVNLLRATNCIILAA
jgi:hypothetical protein